LATRAYRPLGIEQLDRRVWRQPGVVALVVLAVAAGLAVATYPVFAIALVWAVIVFALAISNLETTERLGAMLLLGGAATLGYGWSNVGLRLGPVPLPITEALLVPMVILALADPRTRLPSEVLFPLSAFGALVAVRLVFDYPVWGIYAIRDTTMAIEMFTVVVGYQVIARDGVVYWIKRLRWLFMLCLLTGSLQPWEGALGAAGPQVGLQRSTALFDFKGVKFSVVAAALFFAVFAWPWLRPFLVGWVTGLIGIFQARTLYIMFPATILVLAWASRRGGRLLMRYVPAFVVGALVFAGAAAYSIEGGEGDVSLSFLTEHLQTLTGAEGPNAKTIDAREHFLGETLYYVAQSPGTVLVGVGLGPDLTFGQWVGDQNQLVRNPHDAYLEVYARTGLLGFGIFLWFLARCLVPMARRARRADGLNATFSAWALAACVVYLGVAGAQPILAFSYGAVPLFFFLGMGLAASRGSEPGGPSFVTVNGRR
jgi:hypothetical protein